MPAVIAFVIAVILIASIWSFLGSLAEHERQRAAVLAGIDFSHGLVFRLGLGALRVGAIVFGQGY